MKPGDILLYESTGKWYERAIALATHGRFVHASIVVDDQRVIEARAPGIAYAPLPPQGSAYTSVPMGIYTTSTDIFAGLEWAKQQVGKEYGWLDIVYQAVKFLWPNNPLRFGIAGHMDCADLATRYLQQAGVILPPDFEDPYANSPNDLARVFGLLAPRKGHPREVVQRLAKEQL